MRRAQVCFYGTKDGAIGIEKQTSVRCITISVPTTFPIYLAGKFGPALRSSEHVCPQRAASRQLECGLS